MDITILKNDGVFIYDDYRKGRAGQRMAELQDDGFHAIRREDNGDIKAYLMSAPDYDAALAAAQAVIAALPAANISEVADDYLGANISSMIDLVLGNAQVIASIPKTANEGLNEDAFKAFSIVKTKQYYLDNKDEPKPTGDEVLAGGQKLAYLLHPAHYALLVAAPVAGGYVGVGDGVMSEIYQNLTKSVTEVITVTCTVPAPGAGDFSVMGSVSGALGTATAGIPFSSDVISFLISPGAIDFLAGDAFTINVTAITL